MSPAVNVCPSVSAEVADYLDHLRTAEAVAPSTLAAHRQHLTALAGAAAGMSPYTLSTAQVLGWLNTAAARSTWQNRLTSVRRFYAWAQDTGRTLTNPVEALSLRDCPHHRPKPGTRPGPPKRSAPAGPWAEVLPAYLDHLTAAAMPASTRQTYRSRLYQLADAFPTRDPFSITAAELVDWLAHRPMGREARRGLRATLKGFYGWAVTAGRTATNPAEALPTIKGRPGLPKPIPDHLLAQAYAVADPRTRLVLRLAAELGLRRAEIAQVHAHDVHQLPDGYALLVHGKGQKQRMLPMPEDLARLVLAAAAEGSGWALPNGEGGHLTDGHVSRLAGNVLPEPYTLHTLRHRFATTAYRQCRDLYAVQRLLGHANPQVTERYVSLDTTTLRPIMAASVPDLTASTPGYPQTGVAWGAPPVLAASAPEPLSAAPASRFGGPGTPWPTPGPTVPDTASGGHGTLTA
ncbi:tyrosine-type recombinase/integrase [Micrococcus luteus]|uniref:tyrosine-type recombinase/integrase n=1 Tax=Micrococcus luteus TaxID=1270 RepID=UPI0036B5346C